MIWFMISMTAMMIYNFHTLYDLIAVLLVCYGVGELYVLMLRDFYYHVYGVLCFLFMNVRF